MSDQQREDSVKTEDLMKKSALIKANTEAGQPLEPLLKMMTDNKVLTETVSLVKMKLEASQSDSTKVGELTKELTDKLGPQVGKVLTDLKVKTLIDSVNEDTRGTLIDQALNVFTSTAGIDQIQTIIASTSSSRAANEERSAFNLEPALNMAKSFLELSKKRQM